MRQNRRTMSAPTMRRSRRSVRRATWRRYNSVPPLRIANSVSFVVSILKEETDWLTD